MTRDLRRSIEVLWLLFVACLLSLVLSGVNVAYANSNSDELDMSTYLYVVTTDNNNKNDAACESLIGQSYDTLDNGLKTRLFNSEVGGGAGTDTNPNFPDYAYFRDNLRAYYRSSGEYLWYSRLNGFSYSWAFSAAQKDLQAALRWWAEYGDNVDVPTGPETSGDMVYIPIAAWAPDPPSKLEGVTQIAIKSSSYESLVQWANANDGYLQAWVTNDRALVQAIPSSIETVWNEETDDWGRPYNTFMQSSTTNTLRWNNVFGSYTVSDGVVYLNANPSAGSTPMNYDSSTGMYRSYADGNWPKYYRNTSVFGGGGGSGGSGGPIPDPDPVNPPDPEPVTPVPDPEPVDPGDNWTNIVNNTYNVTQTDVDLQPVIDAISIVNQSIQQANRNINTIDNNLKTGFQAIASQFDAWGNWWSETWNNYTSWQDGWWSWLNQTLEGMRIEFAEYANDITVWLSMIYNKIGSSVTIRNPNVGDNEETGDLLDNFFDWLAGLIEKLVQLITGDLSGAVRTFGDLKTRFPFSIPWDLYALLVLFSHSPVTPVFDLPFSYVGQNWTVYTQYVHIDLSDFDYIAEAFRWCSLALFSLALAWKTPYMIGTLEV